MKKIYLGLLLSSVLLGNVANAAITLPGATVYFNGYVLENSCKISYEGTNGQTVQLPLTQQSDWAMGSSVSNKKKAFAIKLTECACDADLKNYTEPDVYRKISWTVTSPTWVSKTGSSTLSLIKNTGNASNVSIYLKDTDSSNPDVDANNYKFRASSADGDVYNFEAGYAKTNNSLAAGAGSVSGQSAFTIVYE